jgi:hypothetical protein
MPVIDLADYLGMPAQAPVEPLFYQNQQDAAYEQDAADFNQRVAARGELRRLQRQAPILQAQQAQLAYDEIAQKANDLRKKQEIEAQVERAASELAGGNLNPESDDFAVKYRDLATRNPLAFSDPRFSTVAGLYENQYKGYQQAKQQRAEAERAASAKANEDLRTAIGGYLQYGGDSEIAKNIKSVEEAKYLEGQMKKAARDKIGTRGTGTQDVTRQMMEKDYELVDKDWNEMKKEGEDVIYDANDVAMPNPEFQKLSEERRILKEKLRGFYKGKYSPAEAAPATQQQVSPSAVAASSALTGMASAATPFSPVALPASILASALPTPQAPVQQPTAPSVPDFNTQLANIPYAQQQQFIQAAQAQEASNKAIAPAWENAKQDIGSKIAKVVPDKVYPGTSVNQLESFAKAVLKPSENIINNPEYGTIPATWEVLQKAGIPIGEMMTNRTVFREPGENRRLLGFLGTQQVGYRELLEEWAKDFLNKRNLLLSTKESPTGSTLSDQQQKDLDELKTLAGSK